MRSTTSVIWAFTMTINELLSSMVRETREELVAKEEALSETVEPLEGRR